MSKLKRRVSVVCSFLLAVVLVMPLFTACGNTDNTPGGQEPETQCTVTFDKNTSRTTNVLQPVTVDNGKTVKAPYVITVDENDPDAANRYEVIGWYTSKDCKEDEKWNFSTPVTKSMTLYAAWQEKVKVEFYLGATAETPASVQWIIKGQKAEREDGLVGNYKLEGYFTAKDYNEGSEFNFETALNADQKLYLKFDSSKAYLTSAYLSAMTFGYDKHYDDSYPSSISKASERNEEGETYDYAVFDFGNLEQPYVWYNPLNIDIKGKNDLTITYRNKGKGHAIRFYYVVAYAQEGGGHKYSGNGAFGNFVDINIGEGDGEWHTETVDMGKETISNADGISEWGTADLLSIFRIDYPYSSYGATDYKKELVQPGDSILEVREVSFSDNGKDYSAEDTLNFADNDEYTTTAPEGGDWTWEVAEGGELYYKEDKPTAFFPYGSTANTLTATMVTGKEIDCSDNKNKSLTINYDNLGYATSAKVEWKTSTSEGYKNVSLTARSKGEELYISMAEEETWTGTLEKITITYQLKGVDNALTVNSIRTDMMKLEDIPGVSFRDLPMGFIGTRDAEKKAMVVDTTGITKTAEDGKTVLDVNNAIVYKGFTVWYTQGATEATELTLTYTDENDEEHSAKATLASGEGEKSVTFTFVGEDSRSAMSGKIKNIKLVADTGSVFVTYIYFDFDTDEYWNMSVEGTTNSDNIFFSSNVGVVFSTNPTGCSVKATWDTTFNANRNARTCVYSDDSGYFIMHTTVFGHEVKGTGLKGKIYIVLNNATSSKEFVTYYYLNGLGSPKQLKCPVEANMKEGEWTILEMEIAEEVTAETVISALQIGAAKNGSVHYRAIIFR